MKNSPYSAKMLKRVGNSIIETSGSKGFEKSPILVGKQQGYGLWCQPSENEKEQIKLIQSINMISEKENEIEKNMMKQLANIDFLENIDRKLVFKLKNQVSELIEKLEISYSRINELSFKSDRNEKLYKDAKEILEKKQSDLTDIIKEKESLEIVNKNINESLVNARKEITKLRGELNEETEKSRNFFDLNQKLTIENQSLQNQLSQAMNSPIQSDQNQLNEGELNQNNQIINNILQQNNFNTKIQQELQNHIEVKDGQINRLMTEINSNKKKLVTEEEQRHKLNEVLKKKNEKLEIANFEINRLKEIFIDCGKEIKWNQDLVLQKESQIQVLKEKLKKFENEIQQLNRKLERLKSMKAKELKVDPDEIYLDTPPKIIKPKPYLFGPEI